MVLESDGTVTNHTKSTAQFNEETQAITKMHFNNDQSSSQRNLQIASPIINSSRNSNSNISGKQKFLMQQNNQGNWRSTTQRTISNDNKITSTSPSKDNFNFERLEDIQNNKFEKLAALMNINQDTEEINEYK